MDVKIADLTESMPGQLVALLPCPCSGAVREANLLLSPLVLRICEEYQYPLFTCVFIDTVANLLFAGVALRLSICEKCQQIHK